MYSGYSTLGRKKARYFIPRINLQVVDRKFRRAGGESSIKYLGLQERSSLDSEPDRNPWVAAVSQFKYLKLSRDARRHIENAHNDHQHLDQSPPFFASNSMIVLLHNFTGASAGGPKNCVRRQCSCDGVDARTSVHPQASKTIALLYRALRQGSVSPFLLPSSCYPE